MQDKNTGGNTLGCIQTGPRRANAVRFTQRLWMSLQWEQSQPAREILLTALAILPHSLGELGRCDSGMHQSYRKKTRKKKRLSEHEMLQVQLRRPHSSPRKLKFTSHRMWVSNGKEAWGASCKAVGSEWSSAPSDPLTAQALALSQWRGGRHQWQQWVSKPAQSSYLFSQHRTKGAKAQDQLFALAAREKLPAIWPRHSVGSRYWGKREEINPDIDLTPPEKEGAEVRRQPNSPSHNPHMKPWAGAWPYRSPSVPSYPERLQEQSPEKG